MEVKNNKRETGKLTNLWKLSHILLNNPLFKEEITREIKCAETNETKNMTYQNLCDPSEAFLRGKFIAINAYLKKQERTQINKLFAFGNSKEK